MIYDRRELAGGWELAGDQAKGKDRAKAKYLHMYNFQRTKLYLH